VCGSSMYTRWATVSEPSYNGSDWTVDVRLLHMSIGGPILDVVLGGDIR